MSNDVDVAVFFEKLFKDVEAGDVITPSMIDEISQEIETIYANHCMDTGMRYFRD